MAEPKKLLLITMGGTIDAAPFSEDNYPTYSTTTQNGLAEKTVRDLCQTDTKLKYVPDIIPVCNKDSKDINDADLMGLYNAVKNAEGFSRIVITMGTDRMRETALDILSKNPPLECPVIFTGAIWPLANGEKSDGRKNLEQAIFSNSDLPNGIYIAMGDVFAAAPLVYKDFENKKFVVSRDAKAL